MRLWRTKKKRLLIIAGCVLVVGLVSCNRDIKYSVTVVNYGEHGVIVHEIPTDYIPSINGQLGPGIPGVRDDFVHLGRFRGHPDSLPDTVTIEWQLAELTDCERIIPSTSFEYQTTDTKIYKRKLRCTWTPLPEKRFTKVFDMKAVRASEDAKHSGDWMGFGRKRIMRITFIFRDEQLDVRVSSFTSNFFK